MYYLYAVPHGRLEAEINAIRQNVAMRHAHDRSLLFPIHCTLTTKFQELQMSTQELQKSLARHFRNCAAPKIVGVSHIPESGLVILKLSSDEYKARTQAWLSDVGLESSILPKHPYHIKLCNGYPDSHHIYEQCVNLFDNIYATWTVCVFKRTSIPGCCTSHWNVVTGA